MSVRRVPKYFGLMGECFSLTHFSHRAKSGRSMSCRVDVHKGHRNPWLWNPVSLARRDMVDPKYLFYTWVTMPNLVAVS